MRYQNRTADSLRPVTIDTHAAPYAEGSCLISCGNTRVLCTATVDERIPPFLKGQGTGWVTAEYGMLPRATHSRSAREAARGKQSGRTQEIQRLIGRSLRAITDLGMLGERQVIVDCDVLQADGGTRTASITGAYVALHLALEKLVKDRVIRKLPLYNQVAAVSCGIVNGAPLLDLDYSEDSTAEADTNFVLTENAGIIEIQGTAEAHPFSEGQFEALFALAKKGTAELAALQRKALGLEDITFREVGS